MLIMGLYTYDSHSYQYTLFWELIQCKKQNLLSLRNRVYDMRFEKIQLGKYETNEKHKWK